MFFFEEPDYNKLLSYQELGEAGTIDVGSSFLDTFIYEDLSVSKTRNLDYEKMQDVIRAHSVAPELWTQGYEEPELIEGEGLGIDIINDVRKQTYQAQTDRRLSDYEGIVEPNIEMLKKLDPEIRNINEIDQAIIDKAKALREKYEQTAARATPWDAFWGTMGGGVVGAMNDPLNVSTMFIGPGATSFAGGFLRGVAAAFGKSAAVNIGVESVIQPAVFDYKKEIESPYELRDALMNIGFAGIGGGILGGAGYTILRGFNKLSARGELTPAQQRIGDYIQQIQSIADNTDVYTARQLEAHVEALVRIDADLKEGRIPDFEQLNNRIEKIYLEDFGKEINGTQADIVELSAKRQELAQRFRSDVYELQSELKQKFEGRMRPDEVEDAQSLSGSAYIRNKPGISLDAVRSAQKADWEAGEAETKLKAHDDAVQAHIAFKESRKANGDQVKLKERLDKMDAQLQEKTTYLDAAKKARQEYIKTQSEKARLAIPDAPTDSPKQKAFKKVVNRMLANMGASNIKVNVYEGDMPVLNASDDGVRFSLSKKDLPVGKVEADELIEDVPYIENFDFLEGAVIKPTLADLTDAGTVYRGIDSSEVDPVPLQGGPDFPFLKSSQRGEVVWAASGKSTPTKMKGSDYVVVAAMDSKAHKSNATNTHAVFDTVEAYVRDKRITKKNMQSIDAHIRKVLPDFPGIANRRKFHRYIEGMTFETRAKLVDQLASAKAQSLGVPNIDKILRKTVSKRYAGYNKGDALLIIKVDQDQPTIKLGENGTHVHESYEYGIKGKVVGRFHSGVSMETLFPDWFAQRRAKLKSEGKTATSANDYRAFSLALPKQTVTREIIDQLPVNPYANIVSPRQVRLSLDMVKGIWRDSSQSVKDGGVSPMDFSKALEASDASASLTIYSPTEVKKGIKDGTMSVYRLSDSEIYFGLKRGYSYLDEYGVDHPELGPNEVALVGVVNNEVAAKGVGAPSVVLKAIEQGATVLDCFAVKSKKHPNGFLPDTYARFGFEAIESVAFDPSYVTKQQLQDLKKLWSDNGWNESDGYPDIVIMKWRGDDGARTKATQRFDQEDIVGIDTSRVDADVAEARAAFQARLSESTGQPAGINRGSDSGSVRTDNGNRGSSRAHSVVREVLGLKDHELKNLGITRSEVEEIRSLLGERFSKQGSTIEAAIDPETGELHLNIDAFESDEHLMRVLREEVIGHYGLRQTLGSKFQTVINDIKSAAYHNKELRQTWIDLSGVDPRTKQVINENAPYAGMADDVIADEMISKLAREELSFSETTLAKLMSFITKALRAVGLVKNPITMSEMQALVIRSERQLKRGAVQNNTPIRVTGFDSRNDTEADQPLEEIIESEANATVKGEDDGSEIIDTQGNRVNYYESLKDSQRQLDAIDTLRICAL